MTVDRSAFEDVHETGRAVEGAERVFTTAERTLVCHVRVPDGDVPAWVAETIDGDVVRDYSVTLLTGAELTPNVGGADFALACAECGTPSRAKASPAASKAT